MAGDPGLTAQTTAVLFPEGKTDVEGQEAAEKHFEIPAEGVEIPAEGVRRCLESVHGRSPKRIGLVF